MREGNSPLYSGRWSGGAGIAIAAALVALSCGRSPTEPAGGAGGVLVVTALTLPVFSGPGVLTVETAACVCAHGPLLVSVNGASVGSMACAGRQDFPTPSVAAGATLGEVRVTDVAGATGRVQFGVSGTTTGAPSLTVRVLCP